MIMSTIARGRITNIDTSATKTVPGIIGIITHRNAQKLPFQQPVETPAVKPRVGQHLRVLQSDRLYFNRQPIGVVVADTLEIRLRNYAEVNPQDKLPWSSKFLREAYQLGAEKFGWSNRNPKPRSQRDGNVLIGWDMATSTYPMNRSRSVARDV